MSDTHVPKPYSEMMHQAALLQDAMDAYLEAAYQYHRLRLISPRASYHGAKASLDDMLRVKQDSVNLDLQSRHMEEINR